MPGTDDGGSQVAEQRDVETLRRSIRSKKPNSKYTDPEGFSPAAVKLCKRWRGYKPSVTNESLSKIVTNILFPLLQLPSLLCFSVLIPAAILLLLIFFFSDSDSW
jgi:hypothetical protein